MASINGVSIKGIKTFKGHEGEPLAQGNVYIDGKKVGFWSQDSWGGPDSYISDISTDIYELIKEKSEQFKEGVPKTHKYYRVFGEPDVFMAQLLRLTDDEKTWKQMAKKGFPNVAFIANSYECNATGYADLEFAKSVVKDVPKSDEVAYLCTTKEDFVIKVDKSHPANPRILI